MKSTVNAALLAGTLCLALAACNQATTAGNTLNVAVSGLSTDQTVPGSISVTASADGATAVDFELDNQKPVTVSSGPYTFTADHLANRKHRLKVTAHAGSLTSEKTIDFASQGEPTQLTTLNEGTVSGTVDLKATVTGAYPDEVTYSITEGSGGNTRLVDAVSVSGAPFAARYDTAKLANGTYSLIAQARAIDPDGKSTVLSERTSQISVANTGSPAQVAGAFGSEFDPKDAVDAARWQVNLDGSADVYNWVSTDNYEGRGYSANYADVTQVRNPQGSDSRNFRDLDRTYTDADSFEFQLEFNVQNRDGNPNEWKVGRFGLIKKDNSAVTPDDPVNNNANTVSFEVEAQWNEPVGFFALINVNAPDTANPDLPRRRSPGRLSLDPSAAPDDNTGALIGAGLDRWVSVQCRYDGRGLYGPARTFVCTGFNKDTQQPLGSTQTVTLGPDDHFAVDAIGIHASGRRTGGETPTLHWFAGRMTFRPLS